MAFDGLVWGVFVVLIFGFFYTPGSVTLLVMSSAVHGFRAGMATIVGTNLASLFVPSVL